MIQLMNLSFILGSLGLNTASNCHNGRFELARLRRWVRNIGPHDHHRLGENLVKFKGIKKFVTNEEKKMQTLGLQVLARTWLIPPSLALIFKHKFATT